MPSSRRNRPLPVEHPSVYRMTMCEPPGFVGLHVAYDSVKDALDRIFRPTDRSWDWQPDLLLPTWPKVTARRNRGSRHDFPSPTVGVPALSSRAVNSLRHLLDGYCELLPIDTGDEFVYLVNITNVIEALDPDRSDLFFNTADWADSYNKLVFIPEKLADSPIFKMRECPGETCVSAEFVETAMRAGLRGIAFWRLWPLPDGVTSVYHIPPIERR